MPSDQYIQAIADAVRQRDAVGQRFPNAILATFREAVVAMDELLGEAYDIVAYAEPVESEVHPRASVDLNDLRQWVRRIVTPEKEWLALGIRPHGQGSQWTTGYINVSVVGPESIGVRFGIYTKECQLKLHAWSDLKRAESKRAVRSTMEDGLKELVDSLTDNDALAVIAFRRFKEVEMRAVVSSPDAPRRKRIGFVADDGVE